MQNIKTLLADLIAFQSITPDDVGCQDYLAKHLEALGFACQRFDKAPVSNLFARIGNTSPLFVFAGHTDVVPVGERSKWHSDPFVLHTDDDGDKLFGRGTADMKGSIAAMLIAAERFITDHPNFTGSLGLLITSGEEGDDYDHGTPHVMAELKAQGVVPDYCIVGEPSSHTHIGDTLKIGRRGSLTGHACFHGKQGHVAYPHLAENPIHTLAPALNELVQYTWDMGNQYFPPTTLQITHIKAGGEANNIIPGELTLKFNLRYSTEQTADKITQHIESLFKKHHLNANITWRLSGEPFITESGALLTACMDVIAEQTGTAPDCSTSGGTSDARFIAPYGVEVVELGPINASIHQVNEHVTLSELNTLTEMYYQITKRLLKPSVSSE